jgi:CRISPR-associated protein Csx3
VALLAYPEPFHQFDARLGWVTPPRLRLGVPPVDTPIRVAPQPRRDHTHLAFAITKAYLDYTEADGLVTDHIPPGRGVVLSGKLPLWLYTALALTYAPLAPWLAVYQPQWRDEAIVVGSRNPEPVVGDRVTSPPPEPAAT